MNLGDPLADIAPGVRGALLRALARLEQPVSRRQLARLAQVSPTGAGPIIAQLVSSGLVLEVPSGTATLVSLNRDHLASTHLIALAGLRGELIRRLRVELAPWPGLTGAWLFGSTARGDAGPDSDIDILLILDDLESADVQVRMDRLHAQLGSWTGNEAQFVEHTPTSWRRLVRSGNPLVQQLRADGVALIENDPTYLRRTR